MSRIVSRALGRQAAKHAQRRGWLDVRLGIALFRDRRVPVGTKVAALGLGFVLMLVIQALELPLEAVLAAILPFLGLMFDVAIDGLEFIALPLIFGAILLTHLAPRPVVQAVRVGR